MPGGSVHGRELEPLDEILDCLAYAQALCAARGLHPAVAAVSLADLVVEPRPMAHTSHPTWGYLPRLPMASAVWAPEIWAFPAGADLMFAAIRFARGLASTWRRCRLPCRPARTG